MRDVLMGTEVARITLGCAGRRGEVQRAVAGDLRLPRRGDLGHRCFDGVGLVPQEGKHRQDERRGSNTVV